jgi:phosphoglycerol transferase MdoB-like AlkP superfamily enzyme
LEESPVKHDFKQLAKIEKHPRTRIRFIGLSHIQNGKSYEQVAQYLLQSLSAVKQWVVGEKNDYYTLFIVLLFFEFGITDKKVAYVSLFGKETISSIRTDIFLQVLSYNFFVLLVRI